MGWVDLHNVEGVLIRGSATPMGMLQRGRGLIARDPRGDSNIAGDVLECVCRDPRWDHQAEERSQYYAGLIFELDVGVDMLRAHLFSDDDVRRADHRQPEDYWRSALAVTTLGVLSLWGRDDARGLLRAYAVTGANWEAALEALGQDPDPAALGGDLQQAILDQLDDDLLRFAVRPWSDLWRSWARTSPRVARVLAAADATVQKARARPRLDAAAASLVDLRSLVGRRQAWSRDAAAELSRREDSTWLLARLEAVMADTQIPYSPPGLVAAIRDLPSALVLPWARARAATEQRSGWPLMLLAVHADDADIPLLLESLRTALASGDWSRMVEPVQALGRLRAPDARPLLTQAWAQTPYAYLRSRLLEAQLTTNADRAAPMLEEGLWDSESDVRRLTIPRVARTTRNLQRARQLGADPSETARTRSMAREYLSRGAEPHLS